jgi:hypothetical protein
MSHMVSLAVEGLIPSVVSRPAATGPPTLSITEYSKG